MIAHIAGLQADDMISRNLTLDQARTEAFDAMKKRAGPPIRTAQPTTLATGYDDPMFLRADGGRHLHQDEPGPPAQ